MKLHLLFILFFALSFNLLRAQHVTFSLINVPEEIKAINALMPDNEKAIWLATANGLYNYTDGEFKRYFEKDKSEFFQINIVTKDNQGNIWFGTYNGQLVKFSNSKIDKTWALKPYCKNENVLITSIAIENDLENKNPEILLTTSGGEIFSVDTITNTITKIDSPADGTIYSIQYGYKPTIWLCTSDGFFTMNKNSRWKKKPGLVTAYGLKMNEGKYWAIGRDDENKALLMLYYNESNNENTNHYVWKNFDLSKLDNRYTRFYNIAFTRNEIVWIASQDGLIKYNPLNASVKSYKKTKELNLSEIRNIVIQNENTILLSTSGRRFIRVDLK